MGRFSPQHSERDCGSIASPSELLNRAKESPPGNAVLLSFFLVFVTPFTSLGNFYGPLMSRLIIITMKLWGLIKAPPPQIIG